MKRAPIVIAGTAAGLAGVLGFQAQSQSPAASTTTPRASTPAKSTTPSTSGTTTTVTGADAPNKYGDVQVRVSVSGTKITNVTAIALPSNEPKSQEISAAAGPQLAQQALAAQSANIDGVSGASYTSDSYKTSLQSALDKVGITG